MTEREAMGPHEARERPVYDPPASPAAPMTELDALTREMEAAGHPKWAARLMIAANELAPRLLPQMPVSAPVPEPRLPETAMVELTERAADDEPREPAKGRWWRAPDGAWIDIVNATDCEVCGQATREPGSNACAACLEEFEGEATS